jgi:hypothetical protein
VLRRLTFLVWFTFGCTSSEPPVPARPTPGGSEDSTVADPAPAEPAPAEPAPAEPVDPEPVEPAEPAPKLEPTPVYVMLGGTGSSTTKPVDHAVLGHSWGWASATEATIRKCERKNADDIGKQMWCSTEDKPKGAAKLASTLGLRLGKSVFVEPADVASWGITPPASPVWLVGPERVCAATVGRPLVGRYSIDADGRRLAFKDPFMVLELSWELTGCDMAAGSWASVGISASELDPELRWVPASDGVLEHFEPATWTGVLTREIAGLATEVTAAKPQDAVSEAPEWAMRTFEIPGTKIREAYVGAVWRREAGTDRYGCGDVEHGEVFQYRVGTKGSTVIGRGLRGRLDGALVGKGGKLHSLVWYGGDELTIASLRGSKLGRSTTLSTGVDHPEGWDGPKYTLIGYCGP